VQRLLAAIEAEGAEPDVGALQAAFCEARDLAETLRMRPLAAHCILDLGRLHLRAGNADPARGHLSAAMTRFAAMGMTLWVERARADLEAAG
jgi:hypothetical protein